MVYNGLWFSAPQSMPSTRFMRNHSAVRTPATVRLKFYKGSCTVTGRTSSNFSLYDYGLATFDAADTFNHKAAKGFIDLYGLSTKVWAKNRREQGVTDGE